MGRRRKAILRWFAYAGVVFVLMWLLLPLWFPWLLRPVAAANGIHYRQYVREGYGRFRLHGFSYADKSARITAEQLSAPTPTLWFWQTFVQKNLGKLTAENREPVLTFSGWEFFTIEKTNQLAAATAGGRPALNTAQKLPHTFATIGAWVVSASGAAGVIHTGGLRLEVPQLHWTRGWLAARVKFQKAEGDLQAQIGQGPRYEVRLNSDTLHLSTALTVTTNQAGANLTGEFYWWSNRVELAALFKAGSDLPETATVQATNFLIPAEALRLSGYQALKGSLAGTWAERGFGLQLDARAEPRPGQRDLPPARLQLHARGDTNLVHIQSAVISLPWLDAELTRELVLHFSGPLLREPARLRLSADLAGQPWVPLEGRLRGTAEFTPAFGKYPEVHVELGGDEIGTEDLKASTVQFQGGLAWPLLEVTNAALTFPDGSSATAAGSLQLETRNVSNGHIRYTGPAAAKWLPPGYDFQELFLTGMFEGPLTNLAHRAHVEASRLTLPGLHPMHLVANWSGRKKSLEQADVELSAGPSALTARGAVTLLPGRTELQLSRFSLVKNRQPALELQQPFAVRAARLNPATAEPGARLWRLEVQPVKLRGAAGVLQAEGSLVWPASGSLRLDSTRLESTLLSDFLAAKIPEFHTAECSGQASWSNGPAQFNLRLSSSAALEAFTAGSAGAPQSAPKTAAQYFKAEVLLSGNASGLSISNLVVSTATSQVAVVHGFLPVTLHPGESNAVRFERHEPLDLTAAVHPQAFLWQELTNWAGVRLDSPNATVRVAGTLDEPRGEIVASAAQLGFARTGPATPRLENLSIKLLLERDQARLAEGRVQVQGQPVSITAEVPLGTSFWSGVRTKPNPDWSRVSGRFRVAHAQLAAFEPLFPKVLAPQGDLNADVALAPGGKLDGFLAIRNGRTRPLGNTGPVRDIELRLLFKDQVVRLESASATLGGAPFRLTGEADLGHANWLGHEPPPFVLALRGTDMPISRQPDFILRSDLLLSVTKTNGAPPLISGFAHLKDSYYLSDLQSLVPGKVASPRRRPPYFSVDDPMFADWRVAVQADGSRFLRVRTTLFNGEVSANLNLQGTLKDPIALGDLRIDSGVVRFPFAALQVQQGLVNLTSQDPYRPELLVNASSKQFGYDLRMNVSGPADAPVIQFTSNPPLSSEQILLMVTAGELPQGTYSLSAQQRAQTVALFLGRDLLSKLGVGDQTQQRLTIRSGEQMSEQGRPTYNVDYELSDRWSLEGEYDRFGDFNAGFKWKLYSK